jgi:hypothetical protein
VGRTAAGASLTEMASGAGVLGTDGARRGGAARGRAVGEERWGDSRRVMDRIWVCVQPLFRTGLCPGVRYYLPSAGRKILIFREFLQKPT